MDAYNEMDPVTTTRGEILKVPHDVKKFTFPNVHDEESPVN